MNKDCSSCKETKDLCQFPRRNHKYSKDGHYGTCKSCKNAKERALNKTNPLRKRAELIKSRFGITLDQYNELFVKQSGCCGICKEPQSNFSKSFAVDHNHKTNQIRGLLCDNCNRALGQFKDSDTILENALSYIKTDYSDAVVIPITAKPRAYRSR
jgi:hypothetical protein